MTQEQKSNAGQGLGIAGFILGIIALIISWIPCLGMYALIPGIIAIILSAIAFSQAKKADASKGLIIAALVVSILGSAIAGYQYYVLSSAASQLSTGLDDWADEMNKLNKDLDNSTTSDDENTNDSDKATNDDNDNGSNLDINAIDFSKELSSEDYDKILDQYEATLEKYAGLSEKAEKGDLSVLGDFMKLATDLTVYSTRIALAAPFMSQDQLDRFDDINKRFENLEKNK